MSLSRAGIVWHIQHLVYIIMHFQNPLPVVNNVWFVTHVKEVDNLLSISQKSQKSCRVIHVRMVL